MATSADHRGQHGHKYYVLSCWESTLPALATVVVFLRVYMRKKCKISLGWDDFMIIAAIPFVWASWATFYCIYAFAAPHGTQYVEPDRVPQVLIFILANVEVSVMAVNLIKFSIIFFFLRAFGTTRTVRAILWVILAGNILYGFVRFFIVFFMCIPLSNWWSNPVACKGDQHMYWITISIIGTVLEFVMLIFPLPFIWKLRVPLARKLGIFAVFAVALGVVIACVLRIWYFYQVPTLADHIFKDHTASILHLMQELESNVGVLVACLPAMHSPSKRLFATWKAKLRNSSSSGRSRESSVRRGIFDLTLETTVTSSDIDVESQTLASPLSPEISSSSKSPSKAMIQITEFDDKQP